MREVWDLDITIDVQPVVLGGQHDGAVLHESHVKALGMLHLGDIIVIKIKRGERERLPTLLSRAPSSWPA